MKRHSNHTNVEAMRSNLLRSNGGVVLIPEICLQIAGETINSDPKSAGSLLRLSKVGLPGH